MPGDLPRQGRFLAGLGESSFSLANLPCRVVLLARISLFDIKVAAQIFQATAAKMQRMPSTPPQIP